MDGERGGSPPPPEARPEAPAAPSEPPPSSVTFRREVPWAVHLGGVLAGRLLAFLVLLVLFFFATLGGAILHVSLPPARRVVAEELSAVVTQELRGRVVFSPLESSGPGRVIVPHAAVYDPRGALVLEAWRVDVTLGLWSLITSVLFGPGVSVTIAHTRVEEAYVSLRIDEGSGELTLAEAFRPRVPSVGGEPANFTLTLPSVELGRASADTAFSGLPPLHAEVGETHAFVRVTPSGTTVDVDKVGVEIRGLTPRAARGVSRVRVDAPEQVLVTFDGFLGDVSLGTEVLVRGDELDVSLDVPEAAPAAVRELLPGWPVEVPFAAKLRATGVVPTLRLSGELTDRLQRLTTSGTMNLDPHLALSLDVDTPSLDLRTFLAGAPPSQTSVRGHVQIDVVGEQVTGKASASTGRGYIGEFELPPADWTLAFDAAGATGEVALREPDLPVTGTFGVLASGEVQASLRAPTVALSSLPAMPPELQGRVTPRVDLTLFEGTLRAEVAASVVEAEVGAVRVADGALTGTVTLPLASPESGTFAATLTNARAELGPLGFAWLELAAAGPLRRPRLTLDARRSDGTALHATGNAALGASGGAALSHLDVVVRSGESEIAASAASVEVAPDVLVVEGLALRGVGGEVRGDLRLSARHVAADFLGRDVNLALVGAALGLPRGVLAGQVNFEAEVVTTNDELASGHVTLGLRAADLWHLKGISARVDSTLGKGTFTGTASVQAPGLAGLGAVWNLRSAERRSFAAAMAATTGSLEVRVSNLDLEALRSLLPEALAREVPALVGRLQLEADLQRDAPGVLPSLYVLADSSELGIVDSSGEEAAQGEGSRAVISLIGGGTGQLSFGVDGATGQAVAAALVTTAKGAPLVSASGTMTLALEKLLDDPRGRRELLLETPLHATLQVPEQVIEELPYDVHALGFVGHVAGKANLRGTLARPDVDAELRLMHFRSRDSRLALPLNATLGVRYDQETQALLADANLTQHDAQIGTLHVEGKVPWANLAGRAEGGAPWSAEGALKLQGFPLRVFPFFADRHVAGTADGVVSLVWSGGPQLAARVEFADLLVGGLPLGTAELDARSAGGKVDARLTAQSRGGEAGARVRALVDWGTFPPKLSPAAPVRVDLTAKHYDALFLTPLVSGLLSELYGSVDADLALVFEAADAARPEWSGSLNGTAKLTGATAQFAGLGLELRGLTIDALARQVGSQTLIELQNIEAESVASGDSGLEASASFTLEGLAFRSARGRMATHNMPLYLEGVNRGAATGRASFTASYEPGHVTIDVDIPQLTAQLSRESPRQVLPTAPNPDVHVLQPLAEPVAHSSSAPLDWRIAFDLGKDVIIERNELYVPISGTPVIELAQRMDVGGYLTLRQGGRFPVLGKSFVIQQGTVSFDTGDPADPRIAAVAAWRASDGTVIYVDVTGTLQHAHLALRSDPPLPEQEIYARVLGGITGSSRAGLEGGAGGGRTGDTGSNASVAFGPGAELLGLGDLLSSTPLRRVEFLINTTSEGTQDYTAAMQVSPTVWVSATYRYESEAAVGLTYEQQYAIMGAVEWRFAPDWSTRAEAGSDGVGLDLLWQYAY